MDAYNDFENYIGIALEYVYDVPYHDFHLFYEHRKLNLDRFRYINSELGRKIKLDDYYNLVERCDQLRYSYMKNAIKQGSMRSLVRVKESMLDYKRRVADLNCKEAEILSGIIKEI